MSEVKSKYKPGVVFPTDDGQSFNFPTMLLTWLDDHPELQVVSTSAHPGKLTGPMIREQTEKFGFKTRTSAINYFRKIVEIIAEHDQVFVKTIPVGFIYDELEAAWMFEGGKLTINYGE